jgi:hypothetical protein
MTTSPFSRAPPKGSWWRNMMERILANQETTMALIDDLNTAVADLQAEVTAIGTEMDTLMADLTAAVAANNPVAVQAAVDAINAQVAALKAAGTRDMPK